MILAGNKAEVCWGEGKWIFLDIGFSSRGRTCGVAFGNGSPQELTYGTARKAIIERIRDWSGSVNLIIEAPLSVCFSSDGNPKGRRMEKHNSATRYWYTGVGCAVMTAAIYLIRDLHEATMSLPNIKVHLFEGFVTFKEGGTNHKKDVIALREKVRHAPQHQKSLYDRDQLKSSEDDEIFSAFRVAGLDCGIPAVIVVEPAPDIQDVQSSSATTNVIS